MTMNARALKNFFSLRCCGRAQWEIRDVADKMLKLAKKAAPILFEKAGPPCARGPCPEGRMSEGCPVKAAREMKVKILGKAPAPQRGKNMARVKAARIPAVKRAAPHRSPSPGQASK
jgi:thymidylate synthase (FAD)